MLSVDSTDNAALRAEVLRLTALVRGGQDELPTAWALTGGEAAVFRVLLAHDVATPELIREAANTTRDTARVLVCRIRKKVSGHGVEIETVLGRGWRLLGRETWRRTLAARTTGE